jgi:hypothetical protein
MCKPYFPQSRKAPLARCIDMRSGTLCREYVYRISDLNATLADTHELLYVQNDGILEAAFRCCSCTLLETSKRNDVPQHTYGGAGGEDV